MINKTSRHEGVGRDPAGLQPAAWAWDGAVRGEMLYCSRRVAGHSVERSQVGPEQEGVFERLAGLDSGSDCSQASRVCKPVWTEKTLDAWLANPERTITAQKMGFSVTEQVDRADLIAYLRKVSPP